MIVVKVLLIFILNGLEGKILSMLIEVEFLYLLVIFIDLLDRWEEKCLCEKFNVIFIKVYIWKI